MQSQTHKLMRKSSRIGKPAFTLVELMAVITITVILAGLVVGGMGFVKERQAKETARVQIALLSKAIEDYKLDMGKYPATDDKAGNFASTPGTDTSSILFNALYWDSDNNSVGVDQDADQKIYLANLAPTPSKQGWTNVAPGSTTPVIVDPWGNQYCYRSALNGTGAANAGTQNPDFDLWSMGKNGKTNGTVNHSDNSDDIKN